MGEHVGTHRVVIVGGGFGGLQAGLRLKHAPVEVTLVDRRNFHLFQPLTYQVATGSLTPGEIAYPLRTIFKSQRNLRIILAEVADLDLEARAVALRPVSGVPVPPSVPYDTLVIAGGSSYSYFGHEDWRSYATEVKSLESALIARGRILRAFEAAETERDAAQRAAWLTFVVVGGGPTGVEIAGQIAELARDTLSSEFRASDPRSARILLIETADRLLTSFPPSLSATALRALTELGVEVMVATTVIGVDGASVTVQDGAPVGRQIPTRTVVWAAGVTASALAGRLSELTGADLDRVGRVAVESDLTLPGHPEVFALGDMVRVRDRAGAVRTLPGLAPVAMQQGRYVARVIEDRLRNRATRPFRYTDKGNLATVGRGAAVAEIKRVRISGIAAWIVWLVVHLWYLVGFQNRVLVFVRWSFSFVSHGRGSRLITDAEGRDSV